MKLLDSKPMALSAVAAQLGERKSENPSGELEYEQANTLAYATAFAGVPANKSEAFARDMEKAAALPENVVVQLMDVLPRKEDELKLILAAGKVELPDEQLKEILKVVKKYKS